MALPASAAAASWSGAFQIATSRPLDLAPLALAQSAAGRIAIGFGQFDEDQPAGAQALLTEGLPGRPGPVRTIPGAQQVLATAYVGRRLVALTGSSPDAETCCSAVDTGELSASGFRAGPPLVAGLGGATQALLVPVGRRLLAVLATERGVWAALSAPGGRRFGPARRLSPRRQLPQAVSAIARADGGVIVAWAARTTTVTGAGPGELWLAQADPGRAPAGGHLLLRVPAARAIDEIGLAAGPQPALAWIESASAADGTFHSLLRVMTLGGAPRALTLSDAGQLASGLAAAGSAGGVQLLSWKTCTAEGSCTLRAVVGGRSRSGAASPERYTRVRVVGAIEPGEFPAAAVTARGTPVLAWIDRDGVEATTAVGGRFRARRRLFGSAFAADVVATRGPTGGAVVAWVNGTARERVLAAVLRGG